MCSKPALRQSTAGECSKVQCCSAELYTKEDGLNLPPSENILRIFPAELLLVEVSEELGQGLEQEWEHGLSTSCLKHDYYNSV